METEKTNSEKEREKMMMMIMIPQGQCHKCCNGHNRAAQLRREGGGPAAAAETR